MSVDLSHFQLTPPALVSFSGGRTSGLMLRLTLDAHGGKLPDGVHVAFANTGKERPETLDFVDECSRRWGVPIVWIEYRPEAPRYAVVDYATASRKGEPFEMLIDHKQYLPNVVTRFCTTEMKIRPMKRWMIANGYKAWVNVVGLRADEPRRVAKVTANRRERWTNVTPLAPAGITVADVMKFWSEQPFDLRLEQHEGNCDLCFLKGMGRIEEIMHRRPDLAAWWIEQETRPLGRAHGIKNRRFRSDRPSYAHLLKIVQEQGHLPFCDDGLDTCACTD